MVRPLQGPPLTTSQIVTIAGIFIASGFPTCLCTHDDCSRARASSPGMVYVLVTGSSATVSFLWAVRPAAVPPLPGPGGWLNGTHLRTSWIQPTGSPAAYLEGCNFSHRTREHPGPDAMATACLLLCGPGSPGRFWSALGAAGCGHLAIRRALHALSRCIRLHACVQFEIARLVGMPPLQPIAFSRHRSRVFVSVFLISHLGQSSWFFRAAARGCGRADLPFPAAFCRASTTGP